VEIQPSAGYPSYPLPWKTALNLLAAILLRSNREFRADARACLAGLQPPLQVFGEDNIPVGHPCVITCNHYSRPGFRAWWLALAISAVLPVEVHWVITSAWTFPERRYGKFLARITRLLFPHVARVYAFTAMPPMPPDPSEAAARARAVRQVLAYARQVPCPLVGLAPEGGDTGSVLHMPLPGVGRFIAHLAGLGLQISPVGVYEAGGRFCLCFGQPYSLQLPSGLSISERDRYASQVVMSRIAILLPERLRGEFIGSP
jgi:1-acyl-sn-glycerol-3-phosphate acyltransferase